MTSEKSKDVKILLAPTYELAQDYDDNVAATVEAEYGQECINGELYTLAHHGPRSHNPAPCNSEIGHPINDGTILVSHIDLDTIGGCLAVMGEKIDDKEFWEGAEYIDVHGAHHIHELSQEVQDKLNAFYEWNNAQGRSRYTEVTDVTDKVQSAKNQLDKILDERHPEHDNVIAKGREWCQKQIEIVESKLISENEHVRAFVTDGAFCAASYYSPSDKAVKDATVTMNEKTNTLTLAFEDGGKKINAQQIVQELWGSEAGGRAGIAGSPRNWDKRGDALKAEMKKLFDKVNEKYAELDKDMIQELQTIKPKSVSKDVKDKSDDMCL